MCVDIQCIHTNIKAMLINHANKLGLFIDKPGLLAWFITCMISPRKSFRGIKPKTPKISIKLTELKNLSAFVARNHFFAGKPFF